MLNNSLPILALLAVIYGALAMKHLKTSEENRSIAGKNYLWLAIVFTIVAVGQLLWMYFEG